MKELVEILTQFRTGGTTKVLLDYAEGNGYHGGAGRIVRGTSILNVVWASDRGWDHVSVSRYARTPTYQEMKMIKRFFFKPDEWAIEYHPPVDDYISVNDNVLHMWRPHSPPIPTPPKEMV